MTSDYARFITDEERAYLRHVKDEIVRAMIVGGVVYMHPRTYVEFLADPTWQPDFRFSELDTRLRLHGTPVEVIISSFIPEGRIYDRNLSRYLPRRAFQGL